MAFKFTDNTLLPASEIAEGCHGMEPPFCNAECPMHTDVIGYVDLIKEGKLDEAVVKIREHLFLPGTLGRVCAHPCEKVCRRNTEFAQPVAVAALKRYAADKADREELWDLTVGKPNGKKVAVVGAGPAGAEAAIDLIRHGYAVTIYEKLNVVGGMMRVGIPEYRLPRDIIDFEYNYLNKLGVEFQFGVEIGKDLTLEQLRKDYDAVILAHGAHQGFVPPVKGLDTQGGMDNQEGLNNLGVTTAVDFLREVSLTRNSSVAGKKLAVIGGGDVAMDCARLAFRVGVEQVCLISLEQEPNLSASHHEQVGAREEGVSFVCGWRAEEILSENGRVSGLKLRECKAVFDSEGNFNPEYGEELQEIACDTVVFATGQTVQDIAEGVLKQTQGGRYVVDRNTLATDIPGVFVAGDAAGSTIVVQAMALGRKAALSVDRFLRGRDLEEERNFQMEYSFKTGFDLPIPEGTENLPRKHTKMIPPTERRVVFDECDLGFDDKTAIEEASRCLKCECKKCMKECVMLNDFTDCPGRLFEDFCSSGTIDPIIPYSCNLCGNCTLVCPKKYKIPDVFVSMRKDMVKANKGKSPIKGHGAIDIHQLLSFSWLFTTKRKGGKKNE